MWTIKVFSLLSLKKQEQTTSESKEGKLVYKETQV